MNYQAYRSNGKLLVAVILTCLTINTSMPLVLVFLNNWIYSYKITDDKPDNRLTYD